MTFYKVWNANEKCPQDEKHPLFQAFLVLANRKETVLTSKYVDIPQQNVGIEMPAGV